jgi:8-oxo-dGTP pyrophosphatase MutT (NUDIX family)
MNIRQNVMAIVIDQEKILMIEQANDKYWGFPKGGIDFGETPKEALQRELSEETGITNINEIIQSTQVHFYEIPKNSAETRGFDAKETTIFFVKVTKPKIKLNEEVSNFSWVSFDEIPNKIKIKDLRELTYKLLEEAKTKSII